MNKTQLTWFLRQTNIVGKEPCWPWLGSISQRHGYGKFGQREAQRRYRERKRAERLHPTYHERMVD